MRCHNLQGMWHIWPACHVLDWESSSAAAASIMAWCCVAYTGAYVARYKLQNQPARTKHFSHGKFGGCRSPQADTPHGQNHGLNVCVLAAAADSLKMRCMSFLSALCETSLHTTFNSSSSLHICLILVLTWEDFSAIHSTCLVCQNLSRRFLSGVSSFLLHTTFPLVLSCVAFGSALNFWQLLSNDAHCVSWPKSPVNQALQDMKAHETLIQASWTPKCDGKSKSMDRQ